MTDKLVKNVFGWDHFLLYLSGPIDFDRTGGTAWRDDWVTKLSNIGFPTNRILNPCRKPLKGAQFNLDNESEMMSKYRQNKEWSELHRIMSHITHIDLRFVDKSDIILVNMPKRGQSFLKSTIDEFNALHDAAAANDTKCKEHLTNMKKLFNSVVDSLSNLQIPTFGTIHEIVEARRQRKPVFMVWEGGKEECSAWIMWLVGHRNIFANVDELMTRLENISKGKTAYNADEWLLLDLDDDIEYNASSKETIKEKKNGTN